MQNLRVDTEELLCLEEIILFHAFLEYLCVWSWFSTVNNLAKNMLLRPVLVEHFTIKAPSPEYSLIFLLSSRGLYLQSHTTHNAIDWSLLSLLGILTIDVRKAILKDSNQFDLHYRPC